MVFSWVDAQIVEGCQTPTFCHVVLREEELPAAVDRDRGSARAAREDLSALGESPVSEIVRAEDHELFVETIMTLPNERDRKFIMGHLDGCSIEEMAETHGLEVESARRALNRALDRAREHLELAKRGRGMGGDPLGR